MVVRFIIKKQGKKLEEMVYAGEIIGIRLSNVEAYNSHLKEIGVLDLIKDIAEKEYGTAGIRDFYIKRLIDQKYIENGYKRVLEVLFDRFSLNYYLKEGNIDIEKVSRVIGRCSGILELMIDVDKPEVEARCLEGEVSYTR